MKLSDIGERGWINKVRARSPAIKEGVVLGIGDDTAWLKGLESLLVTCDLLIDQVHFIKDMIPPRLLGRKSLSVNLSDISAMAGVPDYALVGVGFPKEIKLDYVDELLEGFLEVAVEHKVDIIGGDTTASPMLSIAVTIIGHPAKEKPVLRSTAQPKDKIWLTGTVGDASLGFEILKKAQSEELDISDLHHSSLILKHFDPKPRIEAGIRLAEIARAMIDVSDGVMLDLEHIIEESGKKSPLRAVIYLDKIPLSQDFKKYFHNEPLQKEEAIQLILSGGEDYELLFTAPEEFREEINKISAELDLPITEIGEIQPAEKNEVVIIAPDGSPYPAPKPWFEHFPAKENLKDEPGS